jgi:hypothetical protein
MQNSNHMGLYIKDLCYLTCAELDGTSTKCIFNWNTLVTGHQQGVASFSKYKPLPRSSASPTVILSICLRREMGPGYDPLLRWYVGTY